MIIMILFGAGIKKPAAFSIIFRQSLKLYASHVLAPFWQYVFGGIYKYIGNYLH